MFRSTLLLLTAFFAYSTFAQEHSIDAELKNCMESNSALTTLGMSECLKQAHDAWDKELNRQYGLLMANLDDEQKASLRKSQLAWLKYRDSYLDAMKSYYPQQGTIWPIIYGQQKINVIKEKALSLESLRESSCLSNSEDCQ